MAVEFEIESDGGPATSDLWDGTLKLIENSWSPSGPWPEGDYRHVEFGAQPQFSHFPPIDDKFALVAKDTESNLIDARTALEALFESARSSNSNPLRPDYTWLRAKADAENDKRTLLYKMMASSPARHGVSFFLDGEPLIHVANVNVDRHPFWESTGYGDVPDDYPVIQGANLDSVGASFVYANIPGTMLARLALTRIETAAIQPLTRVWVGVREEYAGTANFNSRHECENAALASGGLFNGSVVVVDATASGGNKVQVPFNILATFGIRFDTRFGDISLAYSQDMIGRYTVLMRAKVTTGATVRTQLRYGSALAAGATTLKPNRDVYIEDDTWQLYEMGQIQVPAHAVFPEIGSYTLDDSYFRMQIWAEHITGTPATDDLDCDVFIFIPSEHMVRIDGASVTGAVYGFDDLAIFTQPNDLQLAMTMEAGDVAIDVTEFAPTLWYLPQGDGVVVIAAQRADQSVLGDLMTVRMSYVPRWHSFRDT